METPKLGPAHPRDVLRCATFCVIRVIYGREQVAAEGTLPLPSGEALEKPREASRDRKKADDGRTENKRTVASEFTQRSLRRGV